MPTLPTPTTRRITSAIAYFCSSTRMSTFAEARYALKNASAFRSIAGSTCVIVGGCSMNVSRPLSARTVSFRAARADVRRSASLTAARIAACVSASTACSAATASKWS
ncbi:MAG: hypothetical protein ABS61_05085 [Microbacterium sp. SCN 70-18]|nr:hypothetical protein [Microbacterium aurantiacum]ODT11261.1 MAG: hypothetical protein ABS61_05085 [Microbacterium sp. SCN 70-18]